MKLVNDVLDEFNGQLSKDDILSMTYKELTYLRRHRRELNELKASQGKLPNLPDM